ncbi:hypothetical protein [Arthrobacter cavernae]|uniref:Uncharacterized protein n=1 Tax=Arthrobacter cavernae TaxID=2817681 RepID=A0A939HHZ6_9MICC|nr:hypothetical protein [Arthrobacter cavernae]MBO1268840.1 hypothetical protein [Arthrobacter cavernae]
MSLTPLTEVPEFLSSFLARVRPVQARTVLLDNLLPPFPLYARVLNRAERGYGPTSSWQDLGGPGLEVDASTQWTDIVGSNPEAADWNVAMGSVDGSTAAGLAGILGRHTSTPEHCWFLFWEGYAGIGDGIGPATTATITVNPDRSMYVLTGPVADAMELAGGEFYLRRPLWWIPADGAWCVGNDLYGRSVYVGASVEALSEILQEPTLESHPVRGQHLVAAEDF